MSYRLREVVLEGEGGAEELWRDIVSGRLPLLFESDGRPLRGLSPVTRYAHGADGGETRSVLAVTADFFQRLNREAERGRYRRFDALDAGGDTAACARRARELARRAGIRSKPGAAEYESAVPPMYTRDGAAHTYLYIAL
nr:AraC family transcriptional regulator [uncultured Oscillibacter sp.]